MFELNWFVTAQIFLEKWFVGTDNQKKNEKKKSIFLLCWNKKLVPPPKLTNVLVMQMSFYDQYQ